MSEPERSVRVKPRVLQDERMAVLEKIRLGILALLASFLFLGGSCPSPPPQPPPQPPPPGEPVFIWHGADQVEITWDDMPVTIYGGDESYVLNRRAVLQLDEAREVTNVQSFMGFDRGDRIEAEIALYDDAGRVIYRRSPHFHDCGPDCYEAYEDADYQGPPTTQIIMDIICRVVAPNTQTGELSARCHLAATVSFLDGSPPIPPPIPPPTCQVPPGEPSEPWGSPVGPGSRPPTKGDAVRSAKIVVGDRCGKDELETLRLLAAALQDAGECAAGPWGSVQGQGDALGIKAADGLYEEWHAVAFTDGCYTPGGKYKNAWPYLGVVPPPPTPGQCGLPNPPTTGKWNGPRQGAKWFDSTWLVGPDRDYCAAVGFTDGRSFCPVRPDCSVNCPFPDRDACETQVLGGDPFWRSDGKLILNPDNRFQARCCRPENTGAKCQGAPQCTWIEVCHADGGTCSRSDVQ